MHRIAALVFAALFAGFPALAQDAYPSRTITLIVPYAPGGGSDLLGRMLAEGLRARLNETVVVQNVAGAGSLVGSHAGRQGQARRLHAADQPYRPVDRSGALQEARLRSAGLVRVHRPLCRSAHDDHGAQGFAPKTFAELVAYAKANQDKFTMASAGMGSATHLCAMLFQEAIGVPLTVVQYKGGGPAVIDVRSGQVDAICDLPTTTSGADPLGRLARLRADRAQAHGVAARRADRDRSRHAEPRHRRLVRPLCAARHAAADHRRRSTRRCARSCRTRRWPSNSPASRPTCCRSTRRRPRRIAPSSPRRSRRGRRSSRRRGSRRSERKIYGIGMHQS